MGEKTVKKPKILYVETNEIALLDIPRALDELGYDVYKARLGIRAQGYHEEDCNRLAIALHDVKPDYAISYDFAQSIAQACFEENVPYLAWVYDSPQTELYTHYAFYPSSYVFVFDKMQQKRLKDIGIEKVYHMPLAIHARKVKKALELAKSEKIEYENEIGFVGQLYYVEKLEKILEEAPQWIKNTMNQLIERCFLKWDGETWMHESMPEECVEYYSAFDNHTMLDICPYITEQFCYEAAVLSRHLANRERVHVLNTLAEKYKVALITRDKYTEQLSDKIRILPGADYDYGITPKYLQNKINLNITLHCIETGVSQRVFDVMAAGGFMLSNYQQELEELFVDGEDIVLYHNMQELQEKVEYYLTHDEERERIAKNGQQKVLRQHNYHEKMQQIIHIVDQMEDKKKLTYMEQQSKYLQEQADKLLSMKTDEAYLQLWNLFNNPLYTTTIWMNTKLGQLKEMLNCWHREYGWGESLIFSDVQNLEQADEKYLTVKHSIWRIEQHLSEDACRAGVERIHMPSVPKYFMAWIIRANLDRTVETMIDLSAYLGEINVLEAVELLNYGLIFYPKNADMLMQKANYLMELNAWKEAFVTLKEIEQPQQGVVEIIQELEQVLGMNG